MPKKSNTLLYVGGLGLLALALRKKAPPSLEETTQDAPQAPPEGPQEASQAPEVPKAPLDDTRPPEAIPTPAADAVKEEKKKINKKKQGKKPEDVNIPTSEIPSDMEALLARNIEELKEELVVLDKQRSALAVMVVDFNTLEKAKEIRDRQVPLIFSSREEEEKILKEKEEARAQIDALFKAGRIYSRKDFDNAIARLQELNGSGAGDAGLIQHKKEELALQEKQLQILTDERKK